MKSQRLFPLLLLAIQFLLWKGAHAQMNCTSYSVLADISGSVLTDISGSGSTDKLVGCGSGTLDSYEDCDDGNLKNGDGCSSECQIEFGFECCVNVSMPTISDCSLLHLFDLDVSDGSDSLNSPDVNFTLREDFLLYLDLYNFVLLNESLWDNITVVIIDDPNIDDEGTVNVAVENAFDANRIKNILVVNEQILTGDLTRLNNILEADVYRGKVLTPTSQETNATLFVSTIFNSIMFDFDSDTDFAARNVCIIAESENLQTFGCITVSFIGENNHPPVITYIPDGPAVFQEGTASPVLILNGSLDIIDEDHPSFKLQSAVIELDDANEFENLSLNRSFPVNSSYDPASGELTIVGQGDTDLYKEILLNVVYYNSQEEPNMPVMMRNLEISVSDGKFVNTIEVNLLLVNTNDVPTIVFSANQLNVYDEGNGTSIVDSNLQVIDPDPNAMINRITVTLFAVDEGHEQLYLNESLAALNVTKGQLVISISDGDIPAVYTNILQSLKYEHNDTLPGNPTKGNRTIQFYIEDETSYNTVNFTFAIQPKNDPPILLFFADPPSEIILIGITSKNLSYIEDDQLILLATDLYLRDVDSNISSITIELTGLLNGKSDKFSVNEDLLDMYGIAVEYDKLNSSINRTIILSGEAYPKVYEQILRSFFYVNLLTNDSVSDGIRIVTIQANDTYGLLSESIEIFLNVEDRNDEPVLTVNDILQFTEGSMSIEIVTLHLLDLIDEEMDNISSINVTLSATNGELDELEYIFLRTPLIPLLDFAKMTQTSITINANGTVEEYENILRVIRYINQEDEPTYYANATTSEVLERKITITITDSDEKPSTAVHYIAINITLINDNRPGININVNDLSCLAVYPGEKSNVVKRDTQWAGKVRRRLQNKRRNNIPGVAPTILTSYAQFSSSNAYCISNITVIFSANTTTPVVEVRRDLQELISLTPLKLSSSISHGKWLDYRTMVIYFGTCYEWIEDQGSEMRIIFEPLQDECNTTSKCTSGICFTNKTGCPVTGFSSIATNFTPITSVTESPIPSMSSRTHGVISPYVGLLLVAAVVIVIFVVGGRMAWTSPDKSVDNSVLMEKLPLMSSKTKYLDYSGSKNVQTLTPTFDTKTIPPTSVKTVPSNSISNTTSAKNPNHQKPLPKQSNDVDNTQKEYEQQHKEEEFQVEEEKEENEVEMKEADLREEMCIVTPSPSTPSLIHDSPDIHSEEVKESSKKPSVTRQSHNSQTNSTSANIDLNKLDSKDRGFKM